MAVNPTAQTNFTKDAAFRWGVQDRLVIVAVPAGASTALVGQQLQGQALTVDGNYECLIPMSGLKDILECHITATLAGGAAVTTDLDSLYYVSDPTDPATWTEKQAGAGDGALVSATRQTSTIATPVGEQFARVQLAKSGGGTATFTQAEYNGI